MSDPTPQLSDAGEFDEGSSERRGDWALTAVSRQLNA